MASEGVQKAGDVIIEQLQLVSVEDVVYDLTEFLIELNIFEDMFSTFLQGNIVISDSLNLYEKAKLVGEEVLFLRIKTPSFGIPIQKTFKVFKISDRNIARDNNTQTFVMHFSSIELYHDILLPLFLPFEGPIHEVVGKIFEDFSQASRNYTVNTSGTGSSIAISEVEFSTPLVLINEPSNKVKFVSPGWSPFRCITWLASKSIPKETTAKNFLFFETNKAFYFGSIDFILKDATENNLSIGTYSISASNIRDGANAPNIDREYFIAKDVFMVDTTDHVKNYTNGYLASRLITLDVHNKKYEVEDYDYVKEYENQYHTSGKGSSAVPVFTKDTLRNPSTDISYYPVNEKLFNNFKDNISEKMKEIHGNRKSSLLDLTNLRLNITVPGRTDIQVGSILYFKYPALGASDGSDKAVEKEDKLYSGNYLITAIRHKINKNEHQMVMEIVKDSLKLKE